MHSAEKRPVDGGPAFPGMAREVHLPADDNRPFQVVQQPMNGMSVRDVATLQILSALITARCCFPSTPIAPLVIEAMDAADVWLELRDQI